MHVLKVLSVTLASSIALIAAGPAVAQQSSGTTATPTPAPIPVQPTPAPSGTPATAPTVAQALQASPDHTTLVKLVQAANLDGVLSGSGPVTIFAPDDAAFGRLAPGTVDQLLDPAHQWSTQQVVKYLIVQGSYTTQDLLTQLKTTPTLTLNTLDGQPLTLSLAGPSAIQLTDAAGNKAGFVSKLSDKESNGVIEYVNGVPTPKMLPKPPEAPGAAAPAPGAPGTTAPDATKPPATPATGDTDGQDSSGG
ncbi:MAG TPA: fasciclin domain-containing protein [Sphingomonas sp.]|nr:fasciclin domain-containing protein [Sphingomonas sp.]